MMRSTIVLCAAALLLGLGSPVLAQGNPLRDAYFGETHVHTSWSLDALFGNRITDPGDAYKYFKGEPIKHPLGYDVKIDTPLDFAGVTDHSEYAGVVKLANDPARRSARSRLRQPLILKNNSQEGDAESLPLRHQHLLAGAAGQGTDEPRDRQHGLEENIEFAEQGQRARQVHGLLLL